MREHLSWISLAGMTAVLVGLAACQPAGKGAVRKDDPEAMAGTEWVLRAWRDGEAAPAEPAVTLRFKGGRFAGSSGCNRYTAPVEAGTRDGS